VRLALLFTTGVCGGVLPILAFQIASDLRALRRGQRPPPVVERVAAALALAASGAALGLIFVVIMLANANLKPALFLIHPVEYDSTFEALERALCFRVLPSEWFARRAPRWAVLFWDFVYSLFALFILISLLVGLCREGLRGGARYILALAAALCVTLLVALAFPSRGPLFVHAEWFQLAGTDTERLANDLLRTVADYRAKPGVRYTVAGISAMPSYHVMAWLCALWLCWWGLPRPWVIFASVLVLLNWGSTVALGWHYALDGVVGAALCVPICLAARRVLPRRAPATYAEGPPIS
jgi:hypothetical protein